MTPYESWHGRKPAVHHLRTFGCVAHVKRLGPGIDKLADRSTPMIFIGYEEGSKAYRFYDPVAKKVRVSRDVKFEELRRWDWTGSANATLYLEQDLEVIYSDEPPVAASAPPAPSFETGSSSRSTTTLSVSPDRGTSSPRTAGVARSEIVPRTPSPASTENGWATPPSDDHDRHDLDSTPPRYRKIQHILEQLDDEKTEHVSLCLMAAEEPANVDEALAEPCWKKAMDAELDAIRGNGTWEFAALPEGHRAIGLKWVYKVKRDPAGNVVKHKARLVAKGYSQRQGVDYDEVFAPVARMETVRLLLALAAHRGWSVHHMDVKSAFLNGDLQEEVYVHQPPGYVDDGNEHAVLRLRKALYGLRQAPRAWNAKLDASLVSLGFERSPLEHAVYRRNTSVSTLLVGVYVDDLVITGSSDNDISAFKEEMQRLFAMSDLGLLSYYLGIEVVQNDDGITLCQSAYVAKILQAAGMASCNATHTPMENRLKLGKAEPGAVLDATQYRSVVGSLRYLCNTRPDITFAVGIVSRYLEAPAASHWAAVKQILRYISGTAAYGCYYKRGDGAPVLTGFSDSDYAGDIDDRRSTTGVVFFLGSSAITWTSQKQKVVALSSCEAEYVAAASAACQGVWLCNLLGELINDAPLSVKLRVDNMSAIALSKNPVHHDRSKHIDVRYHFLRDKIEEGKVVIDHVSTDGQLADILTKALGRVKFIEMRLKLGVMEVRPDRQA